MSTRIRRDVAVHATLSEQAAYWWVVITDETCTQADRESFARWVRRSPERVEAFLGITMASSALKSSAVRWQQTSAEELIRKARESSAQVVPLAGRVLLTADHKTRTMPLQNTRAWVGSALAAMVMVAVVVWTTAGSRIYQTAIGEQRSVVLDDGSIVTINTASEIDVNFGRERRVVRLVRGEALFEVAHDTRRPFDVKIDDMVVRAVGTKFNIDRREQRTTVSVVEGTVKVMSVTDADARGKAAGPESSARFVTTAQRVVLARHDVGTTEVIADLAPLTAWTQRQLVFEHEPLVRVAEEFNRYNRQHILINSEGIEAREITGVFQTNDTYPFIVFISQIPGVHVETNSEGDYVVNMQSTVADGEGTIVSQ